MRLLLFTVLLFMYSNIIAQEFKSDISYKYIYANQWNKAIQTYNFSRPFITEKQPLLIHGLNFSTVYIFKSNGNWKQGIDISYSFFRSSAENENLENTLNLHLLNLGYVIHYENRNGFYSDFIISASSSGLFRNVNGESFEYDEETSKALGIGGSVDAKLGYYKNIGGKNRLSPFISFGYTPFLYSPNSEAVINQTKGLSSNKWTGIFSAQVGLAFHIKH